MTNKLAPDGQPWSASCEHFIAALRLAKFRLGPPAGEDRGGRTGTGRTGRGSNNPRPDPNETGPHKTHKYDT